MEGLLLGIYSFFVWLIFIKLKWLPWNIGTQVTVVVIPIVGLAALILLLNVYAPSSSDVRVYKYTVPIVSQVRGRVVEVPVEEGNRLGKKGEVLFRIDPTPYQLDVNTLEAQLVNAQAGQRELKESARGAAAEIDETRGANGPAAGRRRQGGGQLARGRSEARARAQARRTVPRAGEDRRGQPLRPRAHGGGHQGARGPARRGAQRRNPGARLGRAGRVERAPDRAEARRHAEGRIRAGRADPRAAREREMAARPDDAAITVRLLGGEPAAAPRRLRRRAAGEPGDDARGGGRPGGCLL